MPAESVEVKIAYLGLKPYILIEIDGMNDAPDDEDIVLQTSVTWGGGLDREVAPGILRDATPAT